MNPLPFHVIEMTQILFVWRKPRECVFSIEAWDLACKRWIRFTSVRFGLQAENMAYCPAAPAEEPSAAHDAAIYCGGILDNFLLQLMELSTKLGHVLQGSATACRPRCHCKAGMGGYR
jgi:hypothetical protein